MSDMIKELKTLKPKMYDAGEVFSGKPSGKMIRGYENAISLTPKVDPHYIYHSSSSRDLIVWAMGDTKDSLMLTGHCGCGKSSLIRQVAAKINMPVITVTGHARLDAVDLTGFMALKDGNTHFQLSGLATALQHGVWFILEEYDALESSTALALNSVLEGEALTIESTGQVIPPADGFKFFCTANSAGMGDSSGCYVGVNKMNLSQLDRLMCIECHYPQPEAELTLLARAFPDIPEVIQEKLVTFSNEIRSLFMGSDDMSSLSDRLEVTISTRGLLRWCDLILKYQPLAQLGENPVMYAFDRAIGFKSSKESRSVMYEIAQRVFG